MSFYQYALDLITDVFDIDVDDLMRDQIEANARHLYGLVHARYIVTTRGLTKMVCVYAYCSIESHTDSMKMEKYKHGTFGKCPRVICDQQHLLPMGQHDTPNVSNVKLYCAKCEDIYNPKSSRHSNIDGAYFGTSFHNILLQVYPTIMPPRTQRRYEPRIYGFRVHASAALMRWQDSEREHSKQYLQEQGMNTGFTDEDESVDQDEIPDGPVTNNQDGIDDMFEPSAPAAR